MADLNRFFEKRSSNVTARKNHESLWLNESYVFRHLEDGDDPEQVLKSLITEVFTTAVDEASARNINVDRIGASIKVEGLAEPIVIPLGALEQNTPDAVLNFFTDVEQSNRELELYKKEIFINVAVRGQRGAGARIYDGSRLDKENGLVKISSNGKCLFAALEVARYLLMDHLYTRDQRQKLKTSTSKVEGLVQQLINELSKHYVIPQDTNLQIIERLCPAIELFYNNKYGPDHHCRITVFSSNNKHDSPIYQGLTERPRHELALYYHEDHLDTIYNIRKFFKITNYCFYCCKPYFNAVSHRINCVQKCRKCSRLGPDMPCEDQYENGVLVKIHCDDCDRFFNNYDCHTAHITNNICSKIYRCTQCKMTCNAKSSHQCYQKFCRQCCQKHPKGEYCYISKLKKDKPMDYNLVAFDFETTLIGEDHFVNCVAAYKCCRQCVDENNWKSNCQNCVERVKLWNGLKDFENPIENFVDWLIEITPKGKMSLCFAHFGGRFDHILVLKVLYKRRYNNIEIIASGNKLFSVILKGENFGAIHFRDSYRLFPVKLSAVPETFDLQIESKGIFPYLFNKPEFYHTELDHLPDLEYYSPTTKSPAEYREFTKWYRDNYRTKFVLDDEIEKYILNDVELLINGLIAFRSEFMKSTGIDMLYKALTIASACMIHYRTNIMNEKEIGIVPENGYESRATQSRIALKFLKWYSWMNDVEVIHRDSAQGEIKFRQYSLDGVVYRPNQKPLCIEVFGCAWHFCRFCHKNRDENEILPNNKTIWMTRRDDEKRLEEIKEEYQVEVINTCEIRMMLKRNRHMRRFFNNIEDEGPIFPRDSFKGGRTGPAVLYCEPKDDQEIVMFDIVSMYPSCQFYEEYFVGHPKIINKVEIVNWTKPSDIRYKGFIKCLILPPSNLLVPVLPMTVDGFLFFSLCRTCSQNHQRIKIGQRHKCTHSRIERAFVTTSATNELALCLENGYKILKVFRAYHYEKFSTELFKPYVRQFLKSKIEAKKCKYDDPALRQNYKDEVQRRLGIEIDLDAMKDSPSQRSIAKLSLNSFWGRFGIGNKLSKVKVSQNPRDIEKIVYDKANEVTRYELIEGDNIMVVYNPADDYIVENKCSNVLIAAWTTACARISLYRYMKAINDAPGFKLLYTDTDSVLLLKPKNAPLPFEIGDYLGLMEQEMPDKEIILWVSGGNKQYSLLLKDKKHGIITSKMKFRGISMNENVSKKLTFERFKQQVFDWVGQKEVDPVVCDYVQIRPNKRGFVQSKKTFKRYKPFFTKGIVDSDFQIYPYGFDFDSL